MTVKCKVTACPWSSPSGFCLRKFMFVTANGMCNWIYDQQGRIKQGWNEQLKNNDTENNNVGVD